MRRAELLVHSDVRGTSTVDVPREAIISIVRDRVRLTPDGVTSKCSVAQNTNAGGVLTETSDEGVLDRTGIVTFRAGSVARTSVHQNTTCDVMKRSHRFQSPR
jgi:hypothetical protein